MFGPPAKSVSTERKTGGFRTKPQNTHLSMTDRYQLQSAETDLLHTASQHQLYRTVIRGRMHEQHIKLQPDSP